MFLPSINIVAALCTVLLRRFVGRFFVQQAVPIATETSLLMSYSPFFIASGIFYCLSRKSCTKLISRAKSCTQSILRRPHRTANNPIRKAKKLCHKNVQRPLRLEPSTTNQVPSDFLRSLADQPSTSTGIYHYWANSNLEQNYVAHNSRRHHHISPGIEIRDQNRQITCPDNTSASELQTPVLNLSRHSLSNNDDNDSTSRSSHRDRSECVKKTRSGKFY